MLELNFSPFPAIHTERLTLRAINMNDAEDFLVLRTDIDAMRYIDRPRPASVNEIHELIQKITKGIEDNDSIGWGISLKNESRLIGSIGYHRIEKPNYRAEIGYMLLPSCWKQGYMSEAIKPVINYGFNVMKLHSIEANINPSNRASAQLLKKFHFVKEAYFRENYYFNGKFIDSEVYSLLHS
jgi:ribosomal-protein-alanine N-acetyltransferase